MKPRDASGKPISVNDSVRTLDDRALGDVMAVLPKAEIVVKWPDHTWWKYPAKELRRIAP